MSPIKMYGSSSIYDGLEDNESRQLQVCGCSLIYAEIVHN